MPRRVAGDIYLENPTSYRGTRKLVEDFAGIPLVLETPARIG
jgi:hypothetical protein